MFSAATLQDVARLARVNDSTVSRAFSGAAPVAAKTRRRIMEAAESVGYRPSMAARTTRTGRSGLVGMVGSPNVAYSVVQGSFTSALAGTLHRHGLCVIQDILGTPASEPEDPREAEPPAPRIVREHLVDGLLINYAFGMPAGVERVLERAGLPTVWINQKREANCVHPDDRGAAAEATRFLLGRGHTDIAFVVGPSTPHASGAEHFSRPDREAGYRQAMAEAGHEPRVELLPPLPPAGRYFERLGHVHRCHLELLQRPDRPRAVLCEADGRVMLLAARDAGLRVPEDLAVFAIDSDPGGDVRIAVDRVVVPFHAMGVAAVEELLAVIDDPGRDRPPVTLPFEFHRVGTSG